MATKTFNVALSLDNPRVIQSGIDVRSFDKQSIKIAIELTKNSQTYQIPTGAQIKISLFKLARQEQKIILDVPFTSAEAIEWLVPDYLDGYQGEVRVGVYLIVGAENIDVGYFNITSKVSDIDKASEEFTDSVMQGWDQIEADLAEIRATITQVNTLASDFTANVATKQTDVTSKYNAFDTSVTQAGQTIDDILALQPQFQSVLDETTGKDVISAPEIITARGGAQTLGDRLDESDAQLAENGTLVEENKRGLNYYWIPEAQPPARTDKTGYFINAFIGTSDSYIDNYFEPLRLANSDYISRTLLGKDQSGLYDIWKYIFTPKNPKETIVINSCLHGGEVGTMVAMLRFFHYLLNDWEKYPDLAYIKENVRIVYIPFANPWGVNQTPRTRYNSNGVNLNRNFDYNWEDYVGDVAFTQEYKGTAPFSEVETQYIRDTLLLHHDAIAYLDLHNTGTTSKDFYVALPENYPYKTYDKLVSYFSRDMVAPVIDFDANIRPISAGYAYTKLGIPASVPEWCDKSRGESQYDAVEVTKSLEWFANVIIEHVREFNKKEPFVIEATYSRESTNLNLPSSNAEIPELELSFPIPCDGYITVDGVVVIVNNDPAAINFICPVTGQSQSDFPPNAYTVRHQVYADGGGRMAIPFQAQYPVKKTEGAYGMARAGLSGYATSGTATIYRYRCRITFTPSKKRDRVRLYSATGREGQGKQSMQLTYPL